MRVPSATYRLQIHPGFTLRDALDLVPYLNILGISHLYLSPVFESTPDSMHGYDVTDPTRIRAAVGGMPALRELAAAAQAHRMGLLLDIVPNHMAASEVNPWWRDVLQRGRDSAYASFFDIAWDDEPRDRVLLPILGGPLDDVLDRDELALDTVDGTPCIRYFDRTFPIADGSLDDGIADAAHSSDRDTRKHALRQLLDAQHYQLADWRRSATTIGYRRFFDITGLVGLRVEEPAVFDATHALVRQLVADNVIDALRIDHVDGLRDPEAYLHRLRAEVQADGPVYTVVEKILELGEQLPAWPVEGTTGYDFLNDVSGLFIDPTGMPRLLAQYHRMTGSEESFEDVVRAKKQLVLRRLFAGEVTRLIALLQPILDELEIHAGPASVRAALEHVTAAMPVYRTYITGPDIAPADHRYIQQALTDAHDVVRDDAHNSAGDQSDVLRAIDVIGRIVLLDIPEPMHAAALEFIQSWQQLSGPVMAKGVEDTALYTFTALTSANEVGGGPAQPCVSVGEFHERMRSRAIAMPLTLNATATHDTKRGEDVRTAIHALTEMADEWTTLLRAWVQRSEVFKEPAQEMDDAAADPAGTQQNSTEPDAAVPDAREEILLYQTLVGVWPLQERPSDAAADGEPAFTDRVKEYMKKAIREAKDNTSWARPDEDYETALDSFLERLLRAQSRPKLRADINRFADRVAWHGMLGSLAQTLIKITAPGIPDFYQGTELWSLVLVDPDNRRPVDFTRRAELLARIGPILDEPSPDAVRELLHDWRDARVKLYLTAQALRYRRQHARLFETADYTPVHASGEHAERVVAYIRQAGDERCLIVVPRITRPIAPPEQPPVGDVWGDTTLELPDGAPLVWRNVLTGEEPLSLRIADVFRTVPFALFHPAT